MFCLKCGAIIQPGATTCPNCHAPVEQKKNDNYSFKDYSKNDYRSDDFGKSYSSDDYKKNPEPQSPPQPFKLTPQGFKLTPEQNKQQAPQNNYQPSQNNYTAQQNDYKTQQNNYQPPQNDYKTQQNDYQPQQNDYKTQQDSQQASDRFHQPSAPAPAVPTWKEDDPEAAPTPLAPVAPRVSNTSPGGAPPPPQMYGQSNFGAYQPDTPRETIKDHLALTIFTLLCCCQIGGVIALIFSLKARSANQQGDYETAKKNANTALWIAIISMLIAVLFSFFSVASEPLMNFLIEGGDGGNQIQFDNDDTPKTSIDMKNSL